MGCGVLHQAANSPPEPGAPLEASPETPKAAGSRVGRFPV